MLVILRISYMSLACDSISIFYIILIWGGFYDSYLIKGKDDMLLVRRFYDVTLDLWAGAVHAVR